MQHDTDSIWPCKTSRPKYAWLQQEADDEGGEGEEDEDEDEDDDDDDDEEDGEDDAEEGKKPDDAKSSDKTSGKQKVPPLSRQNLQNIMLVLAQVHLKKVCS